MSNDNRWIVLRTGDFDVLAPHGIIRPSPLLLLFAAAIPCATAQASTEASSPAYPSANFDPSMAFIVVVLVCAFSFLGFFSIYVRMFGDQSAGARNPRQTASVRFRQSASGLDPDVINSFPMFQYSEVKNVKIGKEALECAVCISEFEDDETLRLLAKCDHVFHSECIDAWLASHNTCPVCRANLVPTSDDSTGDAARGTESNESENVDSHNTCTVCRANLVPISNDTTGDAAQGTESNDSENVHNLRSGFDENQIQISIDIDEHRNRDPNPQASEIPKRNRRRAAKFPRSHSTGHSLVQSGENFKRYTLRLPDEARKQIMSRVLNRTTSCVVFPTEGSSRRGYRSGGDGSSRGKQVGRSDLVGRSDWWVFTMTPPFFSRSRSVKSPKANADGDVTAVGTSKLLLTSVKTIV